jgi:hypothetical protein
MTLTICLKLDRVNILVSMPTAKRHNKFENNENDINMH